MSGPRLAVTTVVRGASAAEQSSFLHIVDLHTSGVLKTIAIPESPHRSDDQNPRGGLRGARGVGVLEDRLVVAGAERLFVLDTSWKLVEQLTHPWMGGVHGIMVEQSGVWVTSTAADLLLKTDWDGEVTDWWCWREDRGLVTRLGFEDLPAFDETLDYRVPVPGAAAEDLTHMNSVARDGGSLILGFGQVLSARRLRRESAKARLATTAADLPFARSLLTRARHWQSDRLLASPLPAPTKEGSYAVVRLREPDGGLRGQAAGELIFRENGTSVPNHDAMEVDGLLVYCDSNESKLVARDQLTGERRFTVDVPGSPAFARGLVQLSDYRFAVGSQQPAALHVVDLRAGVVASSLPLGAKPGETVFGIAVVPESFGD